MTEILTSVPEATVERGISARELGSLPVAVTCVFGICTQARTCPETCAGEFTQQPEPVAVLDPIVEPNPQVASQL